MLTFIGLGDEGRRHGALPSFYFGLGGGGWGGEGGGKSDACVLGGKGWRKCDSYECEMTYSTQFCAGLMHFSRN